MTFKENIVYAVKNIGHTAVESPAVFAFILLLTLSQLFYSMIPSAYVLNMLFCAAAVLLLSDRFKKLTGVRKYIAPFFILPFIAQVYGFIITTYNYRIEHASESMLYFFFLFALLLYFSPLRNYHKEVKKRIIHFLISLCFFAAAYVFIYSMAFFIDKIFNLDLQYFDSPLFRTANACASLLGMLVFSSYKEREESFNSKFFTLMFKDIIPNLLIPFFIFAFIFMIKIIAVKERSDYSEFQNYYYIFSFIIFICFIMMNNFAEIKKQRLFLFIFSAVIPLLNCILILRYNVPKYESAKVFFTRTELHEIIINIFISAYYFYCVIKKSGIKRSASFVLAAILSVYFMPIIGLNDVSYYSWNKEIQKEKNNITVFQEDKIRREGKFKNEYVSYSTEEFSRDIHKVIDTAEYKKILLRLRLEPRSYKNNEMKSINYEEFEFALTDDRKSISVTNNKTKTVRTFDVYSPVKESKENERKKDISFETEDLKLVITYCSYTFSNDEIPYSRIDFDVYIKK